MKKDTIKFNYSSEQRAAIFASANAVRPDTKLTPDELQALLDAAKDYKGELEARNNPDFRSPKQLDKEWATMANQVRRIRGAIARVQKHEDVFRELPSLNGLASVIGGIRCPATFPRILFLLEELEESARLASHRTEGHLIINHFTFGRNERDRLKNVYYRQVLKVWVNMIGGKLTYSTLKPSNIVSGPTVRFLRAVTVPVMGEEAAPKPETIPGIIQREKRMRTRDAKLATAWGLSPEKFWITIGWSPTGWYDV